MSLQIVASIIYFRKVDRGSRNFTVQKISQPKNEGWKEDLWAMVNYCAEVGVAPNVSLPESIPLKTRREAQHTKAIFLLQHFELILICLNCSGRND